MNCSYVVGIIGIAVWALIVGYIAQKKGKSFILYTLLSFVFTPLIMLLIAISDEKNSIKSTNPFSIQYWNESVSKLKNTKAMTVAAMLVAMQIVLGRIAAINVGSYLKISFGFIPIAVCGILLGPVWTILMAAVCDILGALLFPSGAFYFGFTLVAIAGGLIYGLFLYNQKENIVRCLLCTLTVALICNILLNTIFLIQIGAMVGPGNEGFWSVMWTRIIKNAVQFPVNGIILFGVWKALKRIPAQLRTF